MSGCSASFVRSSSTRAQAVRLRCAVELMKQLGKQQHVVQLVDAYEHAVVDGGKSVGTEVYLLMELCSGGSLADTIAQRQGRPMVRV